MGLQAGDPRLAGLKPLEDRDLVVLGNWLEGQQYKDKTVRLPWIWTIRPLTREGPDGSGVVEAWNDEGACFLPERESSAECSDQLFDWNGFMQRQG